VFKRSITFETLEDPPRRITEAHWFHLTMPEFVEVTGADPDTNPDDVKFTEIVAKTDDLILTAYGKRLDGGMGFEKSDEIRKDFKKSLAYLALCDELFTDEGALTKFVHDVLPDKLAEGLDKITALQENGASNKEILEAISGPTPPVPPTPPTS
jgi:hypothetical protein